MQRAFNFFTTWQQNLMMMWRSKRLLFVLQGGQGLAEYALILALIAIVAVIALILLGHQVSKVLSTVGHSV
jgi:Flp pilus assembly pilin Flp